MVTLFSINLKELLSQRVTTSVFIKHIIETDTLQIYIHSDLPLFRYHVTNITDKIYKGLHSQELANTVITVYKKYVLNHFFK